MISSARGCSKAPPAKLGQPLLAGPHHQLVDLDLDGPLDGWVEQDVSQRAAVAAPDDQDPPWADGWASSGMWTSGSW